MVKKGLIGLMLMGLLFIGLNKALGLAGTGIESVISRVAYPFLVLQNAFVRPINAWRTKRRITRALMSEYEQLVNDRDALLKEVVSLSALVRQVKDTQPLRDFMKRYAVDSAVVAPILLRNFSGVDFYLIDAGESSGVEPNMIALYNNSLIGKVTEVYPSYSKIELISNPSCAVAAYCASTGTRGIHRGLKRQNATLDYVDHRDEILQGDIVLSSGEGGLFPRGFGLGRIGHVEKTRYGRTIVIEPLVDLKTITQCCIVPNTITTRES